MVLNASQQENRDLFSVGTLSEKKTHVAVGMAGNVNPGLRRKKLIDFDSGSAP